MADRPRRDRGRLPPSGRRQTGHRRSPPVTGRRRSRPQTPYPDLQRRHRNMPGLPPGSRTPAHPPVPLPARSTTVRTPGSSAPTPAGLLPPPELRAWDVSPCFGGIPGKEADQSGLRAYGAESFTGRRPAVHRSRMSNRFERQWSATSRRVADLQRVPANLCRSLRARRCPAIFTHAVRQLVYTSHLFWAHCASA